MKLEKKTILSTALSLGLIASAGSSTLINAQDKSTEKIDTDKKVESKSVEKEKLLGYVKENGQTYKKTKISNDVVKKEIQVDDSKEKAIIKENKALLEQGAAYEDLTPISIEEIEISETDLQSNAFINVIDGIFYNKIHASESIKKVSFGFGAGYELYKHGSNYLFCINYGTHTVTSGFKKTSNVDGTMKKHGYSAAQILKSKRAAAIANHYYKKTKNSHWLGSAQSIIWKGKYHPGKTSATYNQINDIISDFDKNVSFAKKTYTVNEGQTIKITDSKKQLDKYFSFTNEASVEKATGMKISRSGNTITVTNPKGNKKNVKSTLTLKKFNGWFSSTKPYALLGPSNSQDIAFLSSVDTIGSSVNFIANYNAPQVGKVSLHKDMDGEDIYGQLIKDNEGTPIALTDDGKVKNIEGYTIDYLKYPSLGEMVEQDLFEKPITYKFPKIQEKKILVDKIDEEGNPVYELDGAGEKIPVLDEQGNPVLDAEGNPQYQIQQEEQVAKDSEGNIIYTMVTTTNEEGKEEVIYETRTLDFNYPTKRVMDNIYNGEGIEFALLDSKKKQLQTLKTDANGNITSNAYPVGNYYVRETKTAEGFQKITKDYAVKITANGNTKVNNGNEIVNRARMAYANIKKVDKLSKKTLEGVRFDIYGANEQGDCSEEVVKPENMLYSGVTDNEGMLEYSTAKDRSVCVVEGETRPGYILDKEIHKVDMVLDKTAEIELENQALEANLNILKIDEDKTILPGVKFDLTAENKDNEVVFEQKDLVVDENGYIKMKFDSNTPFMDEEGNAYKYILKETETLDDYVLLDPIQFYFALNAETGKLEASKDEFTFEKNLVAEPEQVLDLEVVNKFKTFKVLIEKFGNDNKEERLKGAVFTLKAFDKNGKLVDTSEVKSSNVVMKEKEYRVKDVAKVMVNEQEAPKNYVLDKTPQTVKVDNKIEQGQAFALKFYNDKKVVAKTGFDFFADFKLFE